jgi:hypothetical protein
MRPGGPAAHPEQMPVRIGLLHLPEMLADVVRSAFDPVDAEFDRMSSGASPDGSRAADGLDAVIAGVDEAWQSDVVSLAAAHPRLVVLGLRRDGRQTWLYELVPQPRSLGELDRAEMRSVVLTSIDYFAT